MHRVEITVKNAELAKLTLEWGRPAFTSDDGLCLEVVKSHDYGKPLLLPKVLHTIEIPNC